MSDTDRRLDALLFGIEKSVRYHGRRKEHLQSINTIMRVTIVILSSAAFLDVVSQIWNIERYLVAIVGTIGLVDVTTNFSGKATTHAVFQQKFADLAAIINREQAIDEAKLGSWEIERRQIEISEPPTYLALEAFVDNEVNFAWGWHKHNGKVPLGFIHRILMNWRRFDKLQLPDRVPVKKAS